MIAIVASSSKIVTDFTKNYTKLNINVIQEVNKTTVIMHVMW